MSTSYNRRRGAKSYAKREPRQCGYVEAPNPARPPVPLSDRRCIRLAPRNRYCDEHQTT